MIRKLNRYDALFIAFVLLVLFFIVVRADAQTQPNVQVQAALTWTAPTADTLGAPLTGASALTKYQLYAGTAAIADNTTAQPSAEVPAPASSYQYTTTVPNGSTLFFRVRACNAQACSVLSNQSSKVVSVSVPGAPTGAAVTVTVTVIVNTTP